ncbi:hypothetical protein UT300013_00860 [Paraclostridium sordellii]
MTVKIKSIVRHDTFYFLLIYIKLHKINGKSKESEKRDDYSKELKLENFFYLLTKQNKFLQTYY